MEIKYVVKITDKTQLFILNDASRNKMKEGGKKSPDTINTLNNMQENFVLPLNLVQEPNSFGPVLLIRYPLRKMDQFQRTKQGNAAQFYIGLTTLIITFLLLPFRFSFFYLPTHPHTHYPRTIKIHNVLDF